jgi:hypothetical protein
MAATMKTVPPPRSAERLHLADAIERKADADFQRSRVGDARTQLDSDIFECLEPAVRRAREALDAAHAATPKLLIAKALKEPTDPDQPTVADAEQALKLADQALIDARAARSILRDELRVREQAAERAGRDVETAAKAVVTSGPQQAVIAEFNRAGRHFLHMSALMRTLGIGTTGLSDDDVGLGARIHDITPPGEPNKTLYRPDPAWAAWLAALQSDPDSEVPPLPGLPEAEPAEAAAAAAA